MQTDTTPVLIIGGSLVGLSSAMFLALQGLTCIVVEQHSGSSPHPHAIGYTQRTTFVYNEMAIPPYLFVGTMFLKESVVGYYWLAAAIILSTILLLLTHGCFLLK